MGYRIMQLQNQIGGDETEIIQGISLDYSLRFLEFGYFNFFSVSEKKENNITKIQDYDVKEMGDGFKNILIYAPLKEEEFREESIFLIIEHAYRIRPGEGVERIAGRYSEEGVFLLKPGNKITVTMGSRTEEYACSKFEDKVYLLKIHND